MQRRIQPWCFILALIMKNFRWLCFCVLTLALIVGSSCRRSKDKIEPSNLAAGLISGQSLETVEHELKISPGGFDILMEREPLPSDTRPPYRLLVVKRKDVMVERQPGELVMTFFNDRLMTTQFYPLLDLNAARAAVESGQSISLASGDAHIAPSTRVWVGKDENLRGYIGWIDKKLQAEQDAWVKQYDR